MYLNYFTYVNIYRPCLAVSSLLTVVIFVMVHKIFPIIVLCFLLNHYKRWYRLFTAHGRSIWPDMHHEPYFLIQSLSPSSHLFFTCSKCSVRVGQMQESLLAAFSVLWLHEHPPVRRVRPQYHISSASLPYAVLKSRKEDQESNKFRLRYCYCDAVVHSTHCTFSNPYSVLYLNTIILNTDTLFTTWFHLIQLIKKVHSTCICITYWEFQWAMTVQLSKMQAARIRHLLRLTCTQEHNILPTDSIRQG